MSLTCQYIVHIYIQKRLKRTEYKTYYVKLLLASMNLYVLYSIYVSIDKREKNLYIYITFRQ